MPSIDLKTAVPGPRSQAVFAERAKHVAPGPFHTTPIVAERAEGATIPIRPCFKNGRAEDYALYLPNDEQRTIPGQWTVQIRKAGEVLLSRSFTLL